MMPLENKTRILAMLILLSASTIPLFVGIYYSIPPANSTLFEGVRQRKARFFSGSLSRIMGDTVYLVRDEALVVNGCRLVFTGIQNRKIRLDVFLLELDPQYAYPQNIPVSDTGKSFRAGATRFQLVSAGRRRLVLKAVDHY